MILKKILHPLILIITILICGLYFDYAFKFFQEFTKGREEYSPLSMFIVTGIIALIFAYFRFYSLEFGRKEHVFRTTVFFFLLAPTVIGPEGSIVPFILGGFIPICILMTFMSDPFVQVFGFVAAISASLAITSLQKLILLKIIGKNNTEHHN
jgi:hypothetical protein